MCNLVLKRKEERSDEARIPFGKNESLGVHAFRINLEIINEQRYIRFSISNGNTHRPIVKPLFRFELHFKKLREHLTEISSR